MKRSEAREKAFILLFEQTLNHETIQDIADCALEASDFINDDFTMEIALGVENHCEEIDEIIKHNIKKWNIDRLSKVCITLLRIAVFEIKWEDSIPYKVSVNEAVELSKKYGGSDDSSYLNGVLGSVIKELNPDE